MIRSQSLKKITFGFAEQSSTEHTLTYDFQLIESTATHNNANEFNVFIDLKELSVGESVEIAALYIEALNTSNQINENIDLKFVNRVVKSSDPVNEYDLVNMRYVDNNSIVRNNTTNNFNNNLLTKIKNPESDNDIMMLQVRCMLICIIL